MNNRPPLQEQFGSNGWANWFTQAFLALLGWKQTFNVTKTIDFGSITAQNQASSTVAVTGARSGDAVSVTPSADTAGIVFSGVVTAKDTVTIYAKNFTAGSIDPASTTFRVIVFQN